MIKILCDVCDSEVADDDYIQMYAGESLLPDFDEDERQFIFCSWSCVYHASARLVERVLNEELQPEPVVEPEFNEEELDAVPPPRTVKIPESSTHGRIKIHSTPLEDRAEPDTDIPFQGIRRR